MGSARAQSNIQLGGTSTQGTALAVATSLAQAGNLTGAEETLTPLIRGESGTNGWHFQCASLLVVVSQRLKGEDHHEAARAVSAFALAHLRAVEQKASSQRVLASAYAMAGAIYERDLGDLTSALDCYTKAASANPNNLDAQRGMKRMQKADDTADRLMGKKG